MNDLILRLIYYLWVPENFDERTSEIYELHMRCLEYYSNIFTDAVFVLGMDNPDDTATSKRIKERLINLGFKGNISIKVIKNNPYLREGIVFKNEIVDKLGDLEGLTFFAHSKGLSNITDGTIDGDYVNPDSLKIWIAGMYFFCLNYLPRATKTLSKNIRFTYGAFMSNAAPEKIFHQKYGWQYNGAFFWVNTQKLDNYIYQNDIKIPYCCDRSYAEIFLGDILPFDLGVCETHNNMCRQYPTDEYINPYIDAMAFIDFMATEYEKNEFISFIEKINNYEK